MRGKLAIYYMDKFAFQESIPLGHNVVSTGI